jgi:hypothetical protein
LPRRYLSNCDDGILGKERVPLCAEAVWYAIAGGAPLGKAIVSPAIAFCPMAPYINEAHVACDGI